MNFEKCSASRRAISHRDFSELIPLATDFPTGIFNRINTTDHGMVSRRDFEPLELKTVENPLWISSEINLVHVCDLPQGMLFCKGMSMFWAYLL